MTTLIKRFALAEARRAEKYLEKDLANIRDESKKELAIRIIDDLFSIQIKKQDDYFIIPISNYLKHSINFHEREWKLINRHVGNGFVFLTSHETVRLIRKELSNYISSKIINAKTPSMISGFEEPVDQLISLSKKFVIYTVTTGEYPPCIKHAIEVLEKGENLPHSGRFMLATFLLSRNQSIEQIAPLFKNAPDYNERVTLYQLNHLAGTSGSGTKYSCPSCEKLKTQNLCFAIPECDNILNPLQFGKKRK
jgi:DNA primase large subunit